MEPLVDVVVYPLLFISLFFEVFAILMLFERDARNRRQVRINTFFPFVSVIVPAYNEMNTLKGTIDSLLALNYPKEKLEIIVVDDGSTDGTPRVMEAYAQHPQIVTLRKDNGGKHTALNAGIAIAKGEFIGCLDADSYVTPDSLQHVMSNFDREKIGAVTSSISVHAPKNLIQKMQRAEYFLGILLRHALATVNGLYVTPGPLTVYRKRVFQELGPFRQAHQTEDMEIALRMQKAGFEIQNAPNALVLTSTPDTLGELIKQRTRWITGFLRNSIDYRYMFGNPKYGVLGLFVLPVAGFFIFSGIFMFSALIVQFASSAWDFARRAMEVPLEYTFSFQLPDMFYFPVNTTAILALVTIVSICGLIWVGSKIAEKKIDFNPSLIWYLLVYNMIATIWQIRAISDVVAGNKRSWK